MAYLCPRYSDWKRTPACSELFSISWVFRITSYNVCYTKLLREVLGLIGKLETLAMDVDGVLDIETSVADVLERTRDEYRALGELGGGEVYGAAIADRLNEPVLV